MAVEIQNLQAESLKTEEAMQTLEGRLGRLCELLSLLSLLLLLSLSICVSLSPLSFLSLNVH